MILLWPDNSPTNGRTIVLRPTTFRGGAGVVIATFTTPQGERYPSQHGKCAVAVQILDKERAIATGGPINRVVAMGQRSRMVTGYWRRRGGVTVPLVVTAVAFCAFWQGSGR